MLEVSLQLSATKIESCVSIDSDLDERDLVQSVNSFPWVSIEGCLREVRIYLVSRGYSLEKYKVTLTQNPGLDRKTLIYEHLRG